MAAFLGGFVNTGVAQDSADEDSPHAKYGTIILEAKTLDHAKTRTFYGANVQSTCSVKEDRVVIDADITIRVIQGRPEVFSIELHGDGEVAEVTGPRLRDWSVRLEPGTETKPGRRFLDLRPAKSTEESTNTHVFHMRAVHKEWKTAETIRVLTTGPGGATGFAMALELSHTENVEVRITDAQGLLSAESDPAEQTGSRHFHAVGDSKLSLSVRPSHTAPPKAELLEAALAGQIDESQTSATFVLTGTAKITPENGATLTILSGRCAVSEIPEDTNYRMRLVTAGGKLVYQLRFSKAGEYPVRLPFHAELLDRNGWLGLDFHAPAGTVVPVTLDGLDPETTFDPNCEVMPLESAGKWSAFLPAHGHCSVGWRHRRDEDGKKLFFTTENLVEIGVGAGLLRQSSRLNYRILQGALDNPAIQLNGPGDIVAVTGENILGWTVVESTENTRELRIELSRPLTGKGGFVIQSQNAVGDFPARVSPLRLSPVSAVRHSGYVRASAEGAVNLEFVDVKGMTQLSATQFPGKESGQKDNRGVFVYRFPSPDYNFALSASQVQPEIAVSQIALYAMEETDRTINATIELDVREAPVREYTLMVPSEFSVTDVRGTGVADFMIGSEPSNGMRGLRVLFKKAATGRQLIGVHLERNLEPEAGAWTLQPLRFPDAKSVRGYVGVRAAPGYRITPSTSDKLSEIPLSYFPSQSQGLQQAFRIREAQWTAGMSVEALSQNVQADVFHLYSLKEGMAYGSVLVNFFVVGAPAGEWRLAVPAEIGNLAVDGHNVQDWRQENREVIVTLHQPTLGAATLLLTFEQPIEIRGGNLQPGVIRPLNVQSERGHIQVASPSLVNHKIEDISAGLLQMEALELPTEFRLLNSAPSLGVFQYSARPFNLTMSFDWYEPGQTLEQLAEFTSLKSQVTHDGQVVTEANFQIKARRQRALRVQLPAGAHLWETRVQDQTVNARRENAGPNAAPTILITLNANRETNEPVSVQIRYGQTSTGRGKIKLEAPVVFAPNLMTEWKVTGDRGHQLVPAGVSAPALKKAVRTETGFQWLRKYGSGFAPLFALGLTLALLLANRTRAGTFVQACGIFGALAAFTCCIVITMATIEKRHPNLTTLDFTIPVQAPTDAASLELYSLPVWRAMVSPLGMICVIAGLALLLAGRSVLRHSIKPGLVHILSAILISAGLLCQHGGATLFFVALSLAILVLGVAIPARRFLSKVKDRRMAKKHTDSTNAPSALGVLLIGAGLFSLLQASGPTANAEPVSKPDRITMEDPHLILPDALNQKWRIENSRLYGELTFRATGEKGDRFKLLRSPAILEAFEGGTELRLSKSTENDKTDYWVVFENAGTHEGSARFQLRLTNPSTGFDLPTGRAAVHTIDIRLAEGGWSVESPMAVNTTAIEDLPDNWSGARLILGPEGEARIGLAPRSRNVSAEDTRFYAETTNLFEVSPGAINGTHKILVRPSQGVVDGLQLEIPNGYTVSDCAIIELFGIHPSRIDAREDNPNLNTTPWGFDPDSRLLTVDVNPARSEAFSLRVTTQVGTGPLPAKVDIGPVGVRGAEGEIGIIGLANSHDAVSEGITTTGVSPANPDDFDQSLLKTVEPETEGGETSESIVLQNVYRYGKERGTLNLTVAPVAPEIRVTSKETVSLGSDRLVLASDLNVNITRAGVFKLSFVIPEGLDIEAVSGDQLRDWTEVSDDTNRIVTLHLNGRTLGMTTFALSLSGPAPEVTDPWTVPRLTLREVTRQTGQLAIIPEQGIRLRVANRTNVSQSDARKLPGSNPGALAFRLLEADWQLQLEIQQLEPWLTAKALQGVTLREGQTRTHVRLRYRVENASVKSLRIAFPIGPDEEQTIRANGESVADMVKVEGQTNLWEIQFQRGIIGDGVVDIDFQRGTERVGGVESVRTIRVPEARQLDSWLAVRVSGRLELDTGEPGRGWQMADWNNVPRHLRDLRDQSVPTACFRVVEPDSPLVLTVRRHQIAETLKLRIAHADLLTALSPDGVALTEARLKVHVVEQSVLHVRLPDAARLVNVFVNGESVPVVREETHHLFHVYPPTEGSVSEVRIAYLVENTGSADDLELLGPRFTVPLENVKWSLLLPDGYRLGKASGTLELRKQSEISVGGGKFDYGATQKARQQEESHSARQLLDRANNYLRTGQQSKAIQAFRNASNLGALDEASNEDARVQLRALQTEQAVMSLNTRRQKLYFDNVGEDSALSRNEQLEEAAASNPLLQGRTRYDPNSVDDLLGGNTIEENTVLKRIAGRIVNQQSAAEPALQALDPTVPARGRIVTFTRSVQIEGGKPLQLNLKLAPERRVGLWFALLVLLCVVLLTMATRQRSNIS